MKSGYDAQYREIYAEISKLVKGETNPSPTPEERTKYEIGSEAPNSEQGIPDYWSTALINSAYFPVNPKDEKVLAHLKDVRMKIDEANKKNFTLEFEFSENEFFTPLLLTKSFFYNAETDEIEKTQGCQINWTSQEKNPRVEVKTKKIKKGKNVETKKVESIVESFFDLFADKAKDELAFGEEDSFWTEDFFANSMEYYLNIIDMEDEFDGEDDEDEEDDDDDEEEPAEKKKKAKKGGDAKNEKCKNQ